MAGSFQWPRRRGGDGAKAADEPARQPERPPFGGDGAEMTRAGEPSAIGAPAPVLPPAEIPTLPGRDEMTFAPLAPMAATAPAVMPAFREPAAMPAGTPAGA